MGRRGAATLMGIPQIGDMMQPQDPEIDSPRTPAASAGRVRHLAMVVLVAAIASLAAGCSILGDDDTRIGGEAVVAGADDDPAEPGGSTDDDGDLGTQATFDTTDSDTSDTTADTEPTTTEADPVADNGFCQAVRRNNFEVRFATGASSSTIESEAVGGQVDLYQVDVGSSQILTVSLISSDQDTVATMLEPAGETLAGAFSEVTVAPTKPGSYWICVTSGESGASYDLFVSVIDDNTPTKIVAEWCGDQVNDRGEIRFGAGQTSGTVEDSVIRGERDLYRLDAGAGQALDVLLTSVEDNAVFDLRAPDGELLIPEVSDFRIPLPESGTYEFCVGSTRGNATYLLEIGIDN